MSRPGRCSSSDTAFIPQLTQDQFVALIRERLDMSLDEFRVHCFKSDIEAFDDALFEILYDKTSITPDNIKDRIIVPSLDSLSQLNTNSFKYEVIDRYWDRCIEQKLLFKMTNRQYNNFYDVTAWCAHINTKLSHTVITPIPEYNPHITIKPKGSSYWYMRLNHEDGRVVYAVWLWT